MDLSVLIGKAEVSASLPDVEIQKITADSRSVKTGDTFVADSYELGLNNAVKFTESALTSGANCVLVDAETKREFLGNDKVIQVIQPKAVFAKWAKLTYPKQPKYVVGVTGTNGKTSVAWFFNQLLTACGKKAASVGTLGTYIGDEYLGYSGYTCPEADVIHKELQDLANKKVGYACLEVSSHGLDLRRVESVEFCAGALTNITQDHLDHHGSMDKYIQAKYRFFLELLPEGSTISLNVNRFESLPLSVQVKECDMHLITVGAGQAELVVRVQKSDASGLLLEIKYEDIAQEISVPLVGSFQGENLAHALALALACDVPMTDLLKALPQVTSAAGRMEMITSETCATVVVDYAHTPDALKTAITAVKPQVGEGRKLWTIFGCGGDRDKTKRPQMGKIAGTLSDEAIVTDDNPRTEDPKQIRADVMVACPQAHNIGDRARAIKFALQNADKNDIILLAGKGHESEQIIGTETIEFDDRAVTKKIINELKA